MPSDFTRREFLEATTAGTATGILAAGSLAAGTALGAQGANGKLVAALIGCGGRGTHDANLFRNTPNVELAYVCDVDQARRESAAKSLGVASSKAVADMRTSIRRQIRRCRHRRHARSLAFARRDSGL